MIRKQRRIIFAVDAARNPLKFLKDVGIDVRTEFLPYLPEVLAELVLEYYNNPSLDAFTAW